MPRRGFDDDDDTDTEQDPPRPRRGDRADRPDGNRRTGGRGQPRNEFIDVDSDPSVLVRYLDVVIRGLGEKIGIRVSERSTFVQSILAFLNAKLGVTGGSEVIKFIGAWVQVPAFVKEYLASKGMSPRVLEYSNGFLDSIFTGTALSFRKDTVGDQTKHGFNQKHAKEVYDRAAAELTTNIGNLELRSWEEVPGALTIADNKRLVEILLKLNPEQTAAFQGYCGKLVAGGVKAVEAFIAFAHVPNENLRATKAMDYLRLAYGPPAQSVANTIIDKAVGGVKAFDAAARKHLGVPDQNNDPVANNLAAFATRLNRRRGV